MRSSSGVTSAMTVGSLVGSAYTGGRPAISVHRVAATLNTSVRGDTLAAGEHLGRHEPRRPDADRALLLLLVEQAGDPEVDEHDAALAEDQVLGLDVAVDDLLVVHVLKRLAGLPDVLDRLVQRAGRAGRAA